MPLVDSAIDSAVRRGLNGCSEDSSNSIVARPKPHTGGSRTQTSSALPLCCHNLVLPSIVCLRCSISRLVIVQLDVFALTHALQHSETYDVQYLYAQSLHDGVSHLFGPDGSNRALECVERTDLQCSVLAASDVQLGRRVPLISTVVRASVIKCRSEDTSHFPCSCERSSSERSVFED
jgi:hypothetical protein